MLLNPSYCRKPGRPSCFVAFFCCLRLFNSMALNQNSMASETYARKKGRVRILFFLFFFLQAFDSHVPGGENMRKSRLFVALLLALFCAAARAEIAGEKKSKDSAYLERLVTALADAELITKEDVSVYRKETNRIRQGRDK